MMAGESGGIERKVRKLDLDKLGHGVSDERIGRMVQRTQKGLDRDYVKKQEALYEADDEGLLKVEPVLNQIVAEGIADEMGVYIAKRHHKKLANSIEELKEKIEQKKFDKEKDETEESVREELQTARAQLSKLGFNWDEVVAYLGDRGLDDDLKDSLRDSYGRQAPTFERSKYLNQITRDHKDQVVAHLTGKHNKFDGKQLSRQELDQLKQTFAQTHSIYEAHKTPDKADLLDDAMYDRLGAFYKSGLRRRPKLRKIGSGYQPKEKAA